MYLTPLFGTCSHELTSRLLFFPQDFIFPPRSTGSPPLTPTPRRDHSHPPTPPSFINARISPPGSSKVHRAQHYLHATSAQPSSSPLPLHPEPHSPAPPQYAPENRNLRNYQVVDRFEIETANLKEEDIDRLFNWSPRPGVYGFRRLPPEKRARVNELLDIPQLLQYCNDMARRFRDLRNRQNLTVPGIYHLIASVPLPEGPFRPFVKHGEQPPDWFPSARHQVRNGSFRIRRSHVHRRGRARRRF